MGLTISDEVRRRLWFKAIQSINGADGVAHRLALVAAQIVEDDGVAGRESRDENSLDIGEEHLAIDRPVEQAGILCVGKYALVLGDLLVKSVSAALNTSTRSAAAPLALSAAIELVIIGASQRRLVSGRIGCDC